MLPFIVRIGIRCQIWKKAWNQCDVEGDDHVARRRVVIRVAHEVPATHHHHAGSPMLAAPYDHVVAI